MRCVSGKLDGSRNSGGMGLDVMSFQAKPLKDGQGKLSECLRFTSIHGRNTLYMQ